MRRNNIGEPIVSMPIEELRVPKNVYDARGKMDINLFGSGTELKEPMVVICFGSIGYSIGSDPCELRKMAQAFINAAEMIEETRPR